jgi:hypothetical protein
MLKRSVAFVETSKLETEHEIHIAKRRQILFLQKSVLANQSGTDRHREPAKPKKVAFSPFVQCRSIHCLHDQEKKILYYSQADYRKFEHHERRRRNAFVLTIRITNEQKKRARTGRALISFPRIVTMYHFIISRDKSCRTETNVELKNSNHQKPLVCHCITARAA